MRISSTGSIELNDDDVSEFKKLIITQRNSRKKFNRQELRMCIDENGTEFVLHDHHIIPHWLIRNQMFALCSSTPNNLDLKNIIESYLNDARNECLRKIVEFEITTTLSHGGDIIAMSFYFNPNNLVFGPHQHFRSQDPYGGFDWELLAYADLPKKSLLENGTFSLTEKLLMIGDLQQRGASIWTRDPANNTKFRHIEDRERIGKQVCQWYKEGFDTTENPFWRIHLPTGILVQMLLTFFYLYFLILS